MARNVIDRILIRFCRGVYLLHRRMVVKSIWAAGSADLGRSSSVLVLSLKTDVDEVFIDTLLGYELVDLNALFADKEQGYHSLASLLTLVVTFYPFIFLRVAWKVRYLCIITDGWLLNRLDLRISSTSGITACFRLSSVFCRSLNVRFVVINYSYQQPHQVSEVHNLSFLE